MIRAFQPESVPRPQSAPAWDRSVVGGRPLDIEVGCGAGFHPLRYARENPGRYLVAIEHTRTRFLKFQGRLAHHAALPNLFAVHADAVGWVTHFLGEKEVERYFFLYPNPAHRWHAMPFMAKVLSTLAPGGLLTIATNRPDYAAEARRFMTREWGLALVSDHEIRSAALPPGFPRTHFEKKYLLRGEPCFDLVFRK